MTAIHPASSFNAEASLNAWIAAALQAFSLPLWVSTLPPIIYDFPEVSATIPCFSAIHIPVGADPAYQGRSVGGTDKGERVTAIMEVSCWVSRTKAPTAWYPLLMFMRDAVLSAATAQRVVVISDYLSSLTAPPLTLYKITLDRALKVPVEHDPNPAVERERILIDYSYIYRAA